MPAGTVTRVSRLRLVAATYGLDAVIVALALASAVETALRQDPYRPHGLQPAFEIAATAVMIPALLLAPGAIRRPTRTWMLARHCPSRTVA